MKTIADDDEFHEGRWLRNWVSATGMSQKEFAARAGVNLRTLTHWFGSAELKMNPHHAARIASVIHPGEGQADLAMELSVARRLHERGESHDFSPGRGAEVKERFLHKMRRAIRDSAGPGLYNVPEVRDSDVLPEVPQFDLSVAAGPWADVAETGEVWGDVQIALGLFRVRISGDSMMPDYKSGQIVEFKCHRDGVDELKPGCDYYVQKGDGLATFKRLVKIGAESLEFKAINTRKYAGIIVVRGTEVVRMGRAMGILLRGGIHERRRVALRSLGSLRCNGWRLPDYGAIESAVQSAIDGFADEGGCRGFAGGLQKERRGGERGLWREGFVRDREGQKNSR